MLRRALPLPKSRSVASGMPSSISEAEYQPFTHCFDGYKPGYRLARTNRLRSTHDT